MRDYKVHDDSCDELLVDGRCHRCGFSPDMQSIAYISVLESRYELRKERDSLREKLANKTIERDACAAEMDRAHAQADSLRATVTRLTAERDEARAEVERFKAGTNEATDFDVDRELALATRNATETAEQIAAWIQRAHMGAFHSDVIAAAIRLGEWRTK